MTLLLIFFSFYVFSRSLLLRRPKSLKSNHPSLSSNLITMSDPVASHITATISSYDTLVRKGLRDGNVLEKVTAKFAEIVSI